MPASRFFAIPLDSLLWPRPELLLLSDDRARPGDLFRRIVAGFFPELFLSDLALLLGRLRDSREGAATLSMECC